MSLVFWSICHVLFFLFTSNLLWFQPMKVAFAIGNETDYSALLKLKESISSDPFGVLTSWNSSSHFCNWHGVTCGNQHQRVTQLNLTGYQLHGLISPHIGNLSFLKVLLLEQNSFHGNVPRELGRLFRLQIISLTNNTLVGEFPFSLINCSELSDLRLYGNQFNGQIPLEIGSLRKLGYLNVGSNNLIGNIPVSIGNLSSLTVLWMAENYLEGSIPEEISLLKNLSAMSVATNKMSGTLPFSLYNMSSLTYIVTANNRFNGTLPTNMFLTLPSLTRVLFGGNLFSGPIPTSITNVSGMQMFDIISNDFVGEIPSLGKLKDLSYLGLSSNSLGSNSSKDLEFLKSLMNCSRLNMLDISYNDFGGPLPNLIGNLSIQLTKLYLGGNQIYGKIPTELGNLNNLILLTMENNHLTDIIPATFGKFPKMQFLRLDSNSLSGEIPATLGNLSQLFSLYLSDNMLIGKIPSTIGNCKNLQVLDLSQNNLSGAIPSQVIGLSSLSILLNLSNNLLSGNLPPEVGVLEKIDMIDLSENYLSGGIPETIGDCLSLEYLYLRGNSFNGTIPTSLALLKGLRKLDLSQNNLSGSIPKELQNISVLESFNASFNKLEGEVPIDGVFKNASEVSLIGNGKLCGGIAQLQLPPCPPEAMKNTKHHNLNLTLILIIICSIAFIVLLFSCAITIYKIRQRQRSATSGSTIDQPSMVSYQNLHRATNGFSVQNMIGAGSFGVVYKGSISSEEGDVAIKVLNLQRRGAEKSFLAECNAMRNIRHRNLIKIITSCSSMDYNGNDFKALVFEYMTNGSLEDWLHPENGNVEQPRTLKLEKRFDIVIGVASAVHYLHYECDQPIIHCDLKPSNVLLDDDMVARVSDFGLAKLLSTIDGSSHKQTSSIVIKGTIGYAPPEYGMGSQVSIEGDMYSFGILILEMLTGRRPTDDKFKDGNNMHNYVKVAFPNNILEIVDINLLSMKDEQVAATTKEGTNTLEIAGDLHPNVERCLCSLLKIGLSCSMESPRERMNMKEVIMELHVISKAFVDEGIKDIHKAEVLGMHYFEEVNKGIMDEARLTSGSSS